MDQIPSNLSLTGECDIKIFILYQNIPQEDEALRQIVRSSTPLSAFRKCLKFNMLEKGYDTAICEATWEGDFLQDNGGVWYDWNELCKKAGVEERWKSA